MAEILKIKKNIEERYVGECIHCGCVAVYNNSEIVHEAYQYNEYCYSEVICPNCGEKVHFDKTKSKYRPKKNKK